MSVYRDDLDEVRTPAGAVVSAVPVQTDITEDTNKKSIVTNLEADLVALQTILDTPNATINANPAAHIKTMARNAKRLTRTALNDYTEAD